LLWDETAVPVETVVSTMDVGQSSTHDMSCVFHVPRPGPCSVFM
jgi:hypothetical protein